MKIIPSANTQTGKYRMTEDNSVKAAKLLFLVTEDWYFWSHRLPLAQEAKKRGYEVLVATRIDQHGDRLREQGFRVIPLKMQRRSTNIWKELAAVCELVSIYRHEKPDIVHQVAMKPVLYGSLAARIAGVRHVVNALAGMGYVFVSNHMKARLLRPAICTGFRFLLNGKRTRLILQNETDRNLLSGSRLVDLENIRLIRGAGVDTATFHPTDEPEGAPLIVLATRMLWDKGIGEFVEAAKLLQERGVNARFALVGDSDLQNPNSVPQSTLKEWSRTGIVEWWGKRDDMPEVFAQASVACLPSAYGEGVPKVLLEAAACGLPIVTTDTPGCRDVVRHEENGLLVPVRNTIELADALQRLIENPELRRNMGARGREIAVNEFAVEKVVAETMALYEELLQQ